MQWLLVVGFGEFGGKVIESLLLDSRKYCYREIFYEEGKYHYGGIFDKHKKDCDREI